MKKFFSLFLLLATLSTGVAFGAGYEEGAHPNTKEVHPGSPADPVRVYTLVRFPQIGDLGPNVHPLSSGDVVVWDTISDDGVSVNTIGVVSAASNDAVAGVVIGTIPTAEFAGTAGTEVGRRNWGYIQVYGLNTATKVDGSVILAGGGLCASSTPRKAGVAGGVVLTMTGLRTPSLGFAYDASSAVEEVEVFVRTR